MAELTGERPLPGRTPDSLLAFHAAGYREVRSRLGPGRLLDLGCGEGFESVGFVTAGREVLGVDYDEGAVHAALAHHHESGLHVARMDATRLALHGGSFDWACSSHLIEHFKEPELHVAEVARTLKSGGTAFFITPNQPADFENPFHVHPFTKGSLQELLGRYFSGVWVGGLDGDEGVKADFRIRRVRGRRLLALDFLGIRHKIPQTWYIAAYEKLLPFAYRLVARDDIGGTTGISEDDFFVTNEVDNTTLALFAVAGKPRIAG
ncbi:MAG: class I SAM-dependent methyltransferase [Acidimicrobiales bacterium]